MRRARSGVEQPSRSGRARHRSWRVLLGVVTACCACDSGGAPAPARASASARAEQLAPLPGPAGVRLSSSSPGASSDSVVRVPVGAREPRPVALVLRDRSETVGALCEAWARALPRAFVVCPELDGLAEPTPGSSARGDMAAQQTSARAPEPGAAAVSSGEPGQFTRLPPAAFERARGELRATVRALKQRFGEHVSPGSVLLVANGTSAPLGLRLMRDEPSFFTRAIVRADGFAGFGSSDATLFAKQGGRRVLFVCDSASCIEHAQHKARMTHRAGAEARAVRSASAPSRLAAKDLAWVLEGEARFIATR